MRDCTILHDILENHCLKSGKHYKTIWTRFSSLGTQNYEGILQRPDKGQLLACENRVAACEELSQRAQRVSLIGLILIEPPPSR